ncbi:MAG: hypothetical protein WC792_01940 [Candidatus Micrarchaeia archaeon]|jgi:hypothetical protein
MQRTDWPYILKQLALNAVFWVGIVAMAATLFFNADASLLLLFVGIIWFNVGLLLALRAIAPRIFEQLPFVRRENGASGFSNPSEQDGQIGFRIFPIAYPKVMDEELRDFAPEFIHLDILKGRHVLFGGNVARDALKNFRDMLSTALVIKEVQETPKPAAKKPVEKTAAKAA